MNKRVHEICEMVCKKELKETELLFGTTHLDSFGLLELISNLEEEFGIIFEPEEIELIDSNSTVESITKLVGSKVKR